MSLRESNKFDVVEFEVIMHMAMHGHSKSAGASAHAAARFAAFVVRFAAGLVLVASAFFIFMCFIGANVIR